jgi:type I restriction enzyme S subunit
LAIYKLGELCKVRIGKTPSTKNEDFWKEGSIKWYTGKEVSNGNHNCLKTTKKAIIDNIQPITTNNCILLSMVRYIEPLIPEENCTYNQNVACLHVNQNIIKKHFLFYMLNKAKSEIKKTNLSTSTFPRINSTDIKNIKLNLPIIEEQEKIIEIIKPIELLFLKYSKLVRINTIDNCKKDIKDLIEIIKPIENLILSINSQKKHVLRLIDSLPISESNTFINFDSIKTGKRNADHEKSTGIYNFYTCGSKIRKCDEFSFDGRYILLSGNANLYTWWYNGRFDLYQRVYALKPNTSFFTTYHSVRAAMRRLREESSGSVIKYIKLNDIKRIKMLDTSFEDMLSKLYVFISNADELLYTLEKIKYKSIKLLIK